MQPSQKSLSEAVRLHRGGRLADAEQLYEQILQSDPQHADALHLYGILAHQTGRHDRSAQLIERAILVNARVPAFHNNLGNALKALGRLDDADASYQRALALNQDYFEAHYNRGLLCQAQVKLDEAIACYRAVLERKPDHSEAHNNIGNVLQAQGKFDQALAAYGQALRYRPNFADAHNNAANVLRAQGNAQAAIAGYSRALALEPTHVEALHNVSIALLDQGKLAEAAAASQQALALKPDHTAALCNLGAIRIEQGDAAAAVACYQHALVLDPQFADAALGLAIAAIPVFVDTVTESAAVSEKFGRALDELTVWDFAHPGRLRGAAGSHQPFYLAYRPAELGGLLSRYGRLLSRATADRSQRPPPLARRRPRLVIVSGHVRQHPVWDVILRGIVAHLDRQRFEIVIYHTGTLKDAETGWAVDRVDRFVQGPKPVKAWLHELETEQPDILLYPEIGMEPTVCALAAHRLAPLQVACWGHPITTGLPTMDLFISGELLEGPHGERHYGEHLVRLPGTGVCTEAAGLRAHPWAAPPRPPEVVRFAVCQQPIKFDPADDHLLVQIAQRVGSCEFWLASPTKLEWAAARLHDRLARAFRHARLDPAAHLRVVPWLPREHFLGFLDEMDVFLDCPAFSGYTTAWQALHRGIPIVTWEGAFLRQRLAAGLLRQIGMTEGIVESGDAYVDTAVHFALRSRRPESRAGAREAISTAAVKADGNAAAVRALERTLLARVEALER